MSKEDASANNLRLLDDGTKAELLALAHSMRGDPQLMAQVLWSSIHGAVALLITMQPEHWPHGGVSPVLVDEVVENGIRGFLAAPHRE